MIPDASAEKEASLPPRSRLHSTAYGKWTRRFYAGLVLLFLLLIVGLIGWFYWWKVA